MVNCVDSGPESGVHTTKPSIPAWPRPSKSLTPSSLGFLSTLKGSPGDYWFVLWLQ